MTYTMRARFCLIGFLFLVTLQGCFCVLPFGPDLFSPSGALPTFGGNGLQTNGIDGFPTSGSNGNSVRGGGGILTLRGDGTGVPLQGGALSRSGLRFIVASPTPLSPSTTSSPIASPTSTPSTTTSSPTSPSTTSSPTPLSGSSTPTCLATQTLLVGVCVDCSARVDGCTECSTNDDNTVRCTACLPGLAPDNNGQSCMSGFDCSTVITECATCEPQNNEVVCSECAEGFVVDEQNPRNCLDECQVAARCRQCFLDVSTTPCSSCTTFNTDTFEGIFSVCMSSSRHETSLTCVHCETVCDSGTSTTRCTRAGGGGTVCSTCATVLQFEVDANPPSCSQCARVTNACWNCIGATLVGDFLQCVDCATGSAQQSFSENCP